MNLKVSLLKGMVIKRFSDTPGLWQKLAITRFWSRERELRPEKSQ